MIVDTAKWNSDGKALDQIPLEVTYDEVPDSTDSYYAVTVSDFYPQDVVLKDKQSPDDGVLFGSRNGALNLRTIYGCRASRSHVFYDKRISDRA